MWRLGVDEVPISFKNEYGNRFHIQDTDLTDRETYEDRQQYHVPHTPSRSDTDTTVPNGRFDELADTLEYAIHVVMDEELDRDILSLIRCASAQNRP